MNTRSILLFIAFIFPICSNAQQVLWTEDFESMGSGFDPTWTKNGWVCDFDYQIGTVCFPAVGNKTRLAGVSGKRVGTNTVCNKLYSNTPDALLTTPEFNWSTVHHVALRYDSYFLKSSLNGKTETARIEISLDNGVNWQVLKNAPPARNGAGMIRDYVDLSAYAGQPSIRLGFRYGDNGEKMTGWMIDNLCLFVPAAKDLALTGIDPSDSLHGYYAVPGAYYLIGHGRNLGRDTVHSYTISFQDAGGATQTGTISGLSIPPMDAFSFYYNTPVSITTEGRIKLNCQLSQPGEVAQANDSAFTILHGARFIPEKNLVIEEGTATWSIQAPQGIVLMHQLDSLSRPPTRICIHAADVMEERTYSDYLYEFRQVFRPYFLFDRRVSVSAPDFMEVHEQWKNNFGFARIDFSANALLGHVYAEVEVRPAVDLPGNYRLAIVVTEDGVKGSSNLYAQANGYAGGVAGPMGGFDRKTDPVPAADMKYDYVARSISPSPDGLFGGCLPANMRSGQTYKCSLHGFYTDGTPIERLNAIVLLMRESDSTIVNSKTFSFRTLDVASTPGGDIKPVVHPNPVKDVAVVDFSLPQDAELQFSLSDPLGRICFESVPKQYSSGQHNQQLDLRDLPAGLYFLRMLVDGKSEKRLLHAGKIQKL